MTTSYEPTNPNKGRMTNDNQPMTNNQTGQSLVEFAIILPIFLLMLLGVFEVGWALRSYLTLVSANREAARFASRGIYLDFDEKVDNAKVGYEKILTHTVDSLAGQLDNMSFVNINPADNATMIVTYYSVEPQSFLCPGDGDCANFDCNNFLEPTYSGIADEAGFDIAALNDVEYPYLEVPPGYEDYEDEPGFPADIYKQKHPKDTVAGLDDHYEAIPSYDYHTGGAHFSRIDPIEQIDLLVRQTNQLNCELKKKGLPISHNKNVVVENTFYQEQLMGLPFFTVFVPEDIPLYTHTVMRMNPAGREVEEQTAGSCLLSPVMIPNSLVKGSDYGEDIEVTLNDSGGPSGPPQPGSFGYILWDSDTNSSGSAQNLEEYFLDPSLSAEYVEPDSNPPDTNLGIGDWIASNTGLSNAIKSTLEDLATDPGTEMIFPIWSDADCLVDGPPCDNATGTGSSATFKTYNFVKMILKEPIDLTGNPKVLTFEFVSFEPDACALGKDVEE